MNFHAKDRAAWTAWLEQNHTTASEIHLVFYKKATKTACASYAEAVEEALCFGWSDINKERIARLEAAGKIRPADQKAIDVARGTVGVASAELRNANGTP